MGSASLWFPRVMYKAVDTERYVWSSRRRLENERPESYGAEDDASLRTIFGKKAAEVTRCALSES